ncbi:hypothetical protein O3P69_013219 [Scylla paramamosain]|uniref:Gustatory receptor n=1 Tax=Scylla paramamosain TaxID=85552 RepID=A0AAW0TZ34_SCYPA
MGRPKVSAVRGAIKCWDFGPIISIARACGCWPLRNGVKAKDREDNDPTVAWREDKAATYGQWQEMSWTSFFPYYTILVMICFLLNLTFHVYNTAVLMSDSSLNASEMLVSMPWIAYLSLPILTSLLLLTRARNLLPADWAWVGYAGQHLMVVPTWSSIFVSEALVVIIAHHFSSYYAVLNHCLHNLCSSFTPKTFRNSFTKHWFCVRVWATFSTPFNAVFSPIVLASLSMLTIVTVALFPLVMKSGSLTHTVGYLVVAVSGVIRLIVIVMGQACVHDQASTTRGVVSKMQVRVAMAGEGHVLLAAALEHLAATQDAGISAWSCFTVTRGTLLTIASFIASYIIIILQFS